MYIYILNLRCCLIPTRQIEQMNILYFEDEQNSVKFSIKDIFVCRTALPCQSNFYLCYRDPPFKKKCFFFLSQKAQKFMLMTTFIIIFENNP